LVISGILALSIFEVLSNESEFVGLQSQREEVQQNTRVSLELIGSELRTIPAGESLIQAYTDSISFRAARVWGVICAVGSTTSLDIAVPTITGGASFTTNAGTGVVVNLGSVGTPIWSSAVTLSAVGAAGTTCNGATLGTGVEKRTLTLAAQPINGALTPSVGKTLYIYDQLTYRAGTSTSVPGLWVQRRIGDGVGTTNQPMAGPVKSDGTGLTFQYFAGASTTPITTPITLAATRATVDRVVVVVKAVSRNSLGAAQESKADTVVVSLRNRI
jgi:hypothetical protein